MMKTNKDIKLIIKKKIARRYEVIDKILITSYSPLKTEAQLADFILKKHGLDRYLITQYHQSTNRRKVWKNGRIVLKKISENWSWYLNLYDNGWIRERSLNNEVVRLEKQLYSASDFEERQMIEEEIELEKEITREIKKKNSPMGLKNKARPGELNAYQEIEWNQ